VTSSKTMDTSHFFIFCNRRVCFPTGDIRPPIHSSNRSSATQPTLSSGNTLQSVYNIHKTEQSLTTTRFVYNFIPGILYCIEY